MSGRQTVDYDPVEALLEQGRRDLAAGDHEKARWCFEEVLRRRPDDPRASLGLRYVTRKSERPGSAAILQADVRVVELVRAKRYEEALELLERERLVRPDDAALERSIEHLRGHLERAPRRRSGMRERVRHDETLVDPPKADAASAAPAAPPVDASGDEDDDEDHTLPYIPQRGSISYFPPKRKSSPNFKAVSLEKATAAAKNAEASESEPELPLGERATVPADALGALPSIEVAPELNEEAKEVAEALAAPQAPIERVQETPRAPALGALPPKPAQASKPARAGSGLLFTVLTLTALAAAAIWYFLSSQ
ncbi:MAG: hypothetical protein AAF411_26020 [Myxococcota bacterium]